MLETYGIAITPAIDSDLLHLQVQFMIAALALNTILALSLIAAYKQMSFHEYRSKLDGLTGVMGRRLFSEYCDNIQNYHPHFEKGWFLFLDVDYFKSINDNCGHSTGDQVLRELAEHLKTSFSKDGKIARIGGDEFAVMIEQDLSKEELDTKLNRFLSDVADITLPSDCPSDLKITCSIGACHFAFPFEKKALANEADKLLYAAKDKGRNCYVSGTFSQNEEK